MLNKKFGKLAVLSLMGILGLTSCGSSSDEVYAKPSNYDDAIITIEGNEDEIHNNVLKNIYDSMHEGNVPSKTLEAVLYRYAESIFGTFNKVTASRGGFAENSDLETAVADAESNTDHKIANDFIKAHKAYWLRNDEGKHIDENGEVIPEDKTDWTPCEQERQNIISKYQAIENRVAASMYTKATSGSYTKKHFFDEYEFVKALYKDGKKVDFKAARTAHENGTLKPVIVDYKLEKEDVFNETKGVLHAEYYSGTAGLTYFEDELISGIYNDLLVEQYLLEEEIASVRNSRARYINVLKIEKYSSFTNNADALVRHLIDEIYLDVPADGAAHVRYKASDINAHYEELFDRYATVSKGLYDEIQADDKASAIVTDLQTIASDIYEEKTFGTKKYYNNTTYGDLVKDYEKFTKATNYYDLDMSLYNKFTSSGTVTAEEGLDQATIDIDQTQSITKGWFINGSQPSLDGSGEINKRLFKLSVANTNGKREIKDDTDANLLSLEADDRIVKNSDTGVWAKREKLSENENQFLCSINGAYFLRFEGKYAESDPFDDIVYDDGSAYYIVNVVEAVKDTKLRSGADQSYAETRGADFLNEVIEEVSKKVAETGSYASLSKEHWLKKMDITYHDQKVYDYFKDNYPDLFE